jgi:DNA polymerase III alpha subunit
LNEINGLIKCLVIIQNVKFKSTRRGERYATFFVEDKTKTLEAICWPSVLKKIEDVLVDGECGLLIANSEKIDEKIVLNVKDFIPVNSLIENNSKLVVVELPANTPPEEIKAKMVELLKHHSGDTLLRVEFVSNGFRKEFSHPSFRVKPSEALCMTVEKLFKSPALRFHISL